MSCPVTPGDLLALLRRDPATAGIFSDFDGTLSPIVADPALAEPLAGVPELLGELARRYQVVAVVSGRPVAFLAARLPASILLAGLYLRWGQTLDSTLSRQDPAPIRERGTRRSSL